MLKCEKNFPLGVKMELCRHNILRQSETECRQSFRVFPALVFGLCHAKYATFDTEGRSCAIWGDGGVPIPGTLH